MPKILQIVREPNKILRDSAEEVKVADIKKKSTQELIDNMIETMWQADGVGIAAPQVGGGRRLVIITNKKEAIALINPKITYRSIRRETSEEGCLSVPGYYGPVRRNYSLRVKAQDITGCNAKPLL